MTKAKNSQADFTLRTFYEECGMSPMTINRAIETRYADTRNKRADVGARKLARGRKPSTEEAARERNFTPKQKGGC